ncbi:FAD-dependent monooxygenase asqG [Colletotrichum spaethianum]|uniref:FAD-dependent monooxygenase asqG n=1 Tax=Colletotrichum spaethianum TaxID=700344 RepID=A0AA37US87_9PEZI|nr:FAD-dependent monooxygenase asqG [Colletotrichum spaethianum]GKT52157.1 FAD-dependent monooxygenase asqG [Colletotrichum spaethianum]
MTPGQSSTGTLLVGCDGVRSTVRSEMWRLGNVQYPGYFGSGGLSEVRARWCTLFGISAIDTVPRSANMTMNQDFACNLMSRGGYAYLVLHMPLPKTLDGDDIQPYDANAPEEVARKHWDDLLREGVTFSDVYAKLTRKMLGLCQEYVLQKWHFGRVMLLGDAVHKNYPATGQGAMPCLEENAASPASAPLPCPQLKRAGFEALSAETQRRRAKCSKATSQEPFLVISLYAWRNPGFRLMLRYLLPLIMPDFIMGIFMDTMRPAPCLPHEYANALAGKMNALVGFDDEDRGPKVPLAGKALQSITCLVLVNLT